MTATLVTLQQAKDHLRLTTAALDPGDVDVQLKLDQAEAIIRDYLKSRVGVTWVDETTVPGPVSAAILLLLARLYEQRGDNEQADAACWQAIERLLVRFRDPALA